MSPDKQKLMEDIHSAYHRLMDLADSMELIDGVSLPMIDEAKQDLMHMAGLLEDALAVSEKPQPGVIPGASLSLSERAASFLHLRVIR